MTLSPAKMRALASADADGRLTSGRSNTLRSLWVAGYLAQVDGEIARPVAPSDYALTDQGRAALPAEDREDDDQADAAPVVSVGVDTDEPADSTAREVVRQLLADGHQAVTAVARPDGIDAHKGSGFRACTVGRKVLVLPLSHGRHVVRPHWVRAYAKTLRTAGWDVVVAPGSLFVDVTD